VRARRADYKITLSYVRMYLAVRKPRRQVEIVNQGLSAAFVQISGGRGAPRRS
jgi:hypothetical protein